MSYPQKSYQILFLPDSFSRFGRSISLLSAALILAGCVQSAPTPSPAEAALQSACSGGNLDACTKIADLEARERERETAANQAAIAEISANNRARQYSDPLGDMALGMAATRPAPALAPISVNPAYQPAPAATNAPALANGYTSGKTVTRCVPQGGSYICTDM